MSGLNIFSNKVILEIDINNLELGNSFGLQEARHLIKLLKSKELHKYKGIIWKTPPNGPFCSGGNLKMYGSHTKREQGIKANLEIEKSLNLLAQCSLPTIAIVESDCYGGGVELLSCFDYVLATPHAMLGLWQRRIGLSFGWGGGKRLTDRVMLKALKQESLLARSFSAYEANRIGLVDEVVPAWAARERALDWIHKNARLPIAPLSEIKRWTPALERKIFQKLWFNPEHKSMLQKFLKATGTVY